MVDRDKSSAKHLRAQQAKEFLISQIMEQARRENVSLSEVEQKMLYFTEAEETLPDIHEVNEQFERKYDNSVYEKKTFPRMGAFGDVAKDVFVGLRNSFPSAFFKKRKRG